MVKRYDMRESSQGNIVQLEKVKGRAQQLQGGNHFGGECGVNDNDLTLGIWDMDLTGVLVNYLTVPEKEAESLPGQTLDSRVCLVGPARRLLGDSSWCC
jgi:hypothetical protein